jgi:hypothetical protein
MERYKNLSGTSGVAAYEISQGSLTVQFRDGSTYLYTDQSAGAGNIQSMQQLAVGGSGLSSFIGRVVKKGYASKLR